MAQPHADVDPFVDDKFGGLDLRPDKDDMVNELGEIAEEDDNRPQSPDTAPQPEAVVEPPTPPAPAPETETEREQTYEYPDGAKVTVGKTNRGWRAILETGTAAQPEVFYGKTKDELFSNLAVGKINATKKIRQMNKERKLQAPAAPVEPSTQPVAQVRDLTADEIFEIKTQLQADPNLALKSWFQKSTGMTIQQLVDLANQGKQAKQELSAEGVAKEFMAQSPDYYPDPAWENYKLILKWLSKYKLGKSVSDFDKTYEELVNKGHWTVENLKEAFDDLKEDGLMLTAPGEESEVEENEELVEVPVATAPVARPPAQPAPTPANPRIAGERRRPRAGLGIRTTETTVVSTTPEKPPSVEELDDLPTEQIGQLFADIRRSRAQTRR